VLPDPYITVFAIGDVAVKPPHEQNVQVRSAEHEVLEGTELLDDGEPWVDPGPAGDPFEVFFRSPSELMASDGNERLLEAASRAGEEQKRLKVSLVVTQSVDAAVLDHLRFVGEDAGVPAVELYVRRLDA
jgi:hypothetical protein